ncbi:hypothetical protein AA310_11625 [Arthrobacter sp. YC-RL1]|nr:hypothetical protein ATC04_06395 [Arthrobacter sp. YC-RL1]KLI88452.1 hypothetical protein AA310_11625 [Arthrobacter sp. YC-RL1]
MARVLPLLVLQLQAATYTCGNLFQNFADTEKVYLPDTDYVQVAIRRFSLCCFPTAIKSFGNRRLHDSVDGISVGIHVIRQQSGMGKIQDLGFCHGAIASILYPSRFPTDFSVRIHLLKCIAVTLVGHDRNDWFYVLQRRKRAALLSVDDIDLRFVPGIRDMKHLESCYKLGERRH